MDLQILNLVKQIASLQLPKLTHDRDFDLLIHQARKIRDREIRRRENAKN